MATPRDPRPDEIREAPISDRLSMQRRHEAFSADARFLTRSVIPAGGQPYEHRCLREVYETVAYLAEIFESEYGDRSFTLEEIVHAAAVPFSQAAAALAFMKERGCIVTQAPAQLRGRVVSLRGRDE